MEIYLTIVTTASKSWIILKHPPFCNKAVVVMQFKYCLISLSFVLTFLELFYLFI